MTKGPDWMPLNVGDYLTATDHLTVVEHGAYLLLIMRYWQKGTIGTDETLIQRYAHLSAEQWQESRPVLVALFDEGWKHGRIETELAKAAEIIGKRRASAEQMHSRRTASAEHQHGTGTDTRVPPLPSPVVIEPPASVPEPGARVEFEDVWEAFPRNPSSSRDLAKAEWERSRPEDRADILKAAIRRAQWFGQDCEARGRTVEEGERFEPHLAKWLKGGWRDSLSLPVKGEADPSLAIVHKDSEDFAALKRFRNVKEIAVYSEKGTITVPKAELDQARAQAVH
jgi:uncharacterized protein YdaU (DUF1376 family)